MKTEINLKFIDGTGEWFEVNGPFANAAEARNTIGTAPAGTVAWVIERSVLTDGKGSRRDYSKILEFGGNAAALALGGWVKAEVAS